MMKTLHFTRTLLVTSLMAFGLSAHAADALPGTGVKVLPLQSSIAEETFQTLLVSRALQKLGYDVQPIKEVEYATAHVAIANGDASFMANHWDPLHADFYKNAGGDDKLSRKGSYSANAAQGYLIDKKTADKYKITHIDQLKDPQLAKLFDTSNDGKANLTGCNPGWGCEAAIEHQLTAYKLRGTVTHSQGSYSALMADTLARYKQGKPILYYTWTPNWVSGVLRPGKEVTWLEVPFSALPGTQPSADTKLPNGKNYGFQLNTQRIMANKAFIASNPVAGKLFEIMTLPIGDINAQNQRMNDGENSQKAIEQHADAWISGHQKTFDGWIAQAKLATKK
jgi:glycine betaine/proline transport system substrate-binding protein